MLTMETRGKPRGTRTRVIERAIAEHFRSKYPKLAERFDILAEEDSPTIPNARRGRPSRPLRPASAPPAGR